MRKGFTLIELIVVIAVLGVLAGVLISLIDPLDKIAASNDSGVISIISQTGRGDDAYAATHSSLYVGPGAQTTNPAMFNNAITDLNTAGEFKPPSITPPSGYTYYFLPPAGCTVSGGASCTTYVFYVQVKSKKYTSGNTGGNLSYYVAANGKRCVLLNQAAAPTSATNCP